MQGVQPRVAPASAHAARAARGARCGAAAPQRRSQFAGAALPVAARPAGACCAAATRRGMVRPLAAPAPSQQAAGWQPAGGGQVVQANLFERAVRVVKSYANAIVSRAEDPEKMLEQTVNEMQEDLIKMRQASAQVMASQKQLENKYKQAQTTADDWYRRAQLALEKGDEDLAREALKRRQTYQTDADSMRMQVEQQREAVDKMIQNTRLLEQKMAEAKSKKDTLKARAASAKTSKQIGEMVGNLSTSTSLAAFERMEEKVLAMEAEADSIQALAAPSELLDKFKALEGGGVDDELAKMKRGMLGDKSSAPRGELPAGRKVSDAIEMELEALRKKANDA